MGIVNKVQQAGRAAPAALRPAIKTGSNSRIVHLRAFIRRMRACGVKAKPPDMIMPLNKVPSPAGTLLLRKTYGVNSLLTVYHEDVGKPAIPRILSEEQLASENNTVFGEGNIRPGYFVGSVYPAKGGRLLATLRYPEQKMAVMYFEKQKWLC